jgi:hypothetical protein
MQKLRAFLLKPQNVFIVYAIAAIILSIMMVLQGKGLFCPTKNTGIISDMVNTPAVQDLFKGRYLTQYNNYVIYKYSFFHLLQGSDLYALHPPDHWDLFKYSPTFALFMGLFAWAPDVLGLSMWFVFNAFILYWAISMLPFNEKTKAFLLWFLLAEYITSIENCQVNGMLTGLMIAGYCYMQRGKSIWAALVLVIAVFIKLYGAAAFALFLFFPDKIRFILYSILWALILFLLPLVVTPFHTLTWQYQNWAHMIAADQAVSYGISVFGWLYSWFGINAKTFILAVGIVLFVLPFLRISLYQNELYRLLSLAAILIWVIVFNHKAESATFIIAIAGIGIWYFAEKPKPWRSILLWLTFVFTCLSYTDICPPAIKDNFIRPYAIKAVPCVILWCIIIAELLFMKPGKLLYNTKKSN